MQANRKWALASLLLAIGVQSAIGQPAARPQAGASES